MKNIPWVELKSKLELLPTSNLPITIDKLGTILDEKTFIKSHISTVDSAPVKDSYTDKEKRYRLYVVKPFYDRLMMYYILKTELKGAF